MQGASVDPEQVRKRDFMDRVDAKLSSLPDGTSVAVVIMTGSFCPVTEGHVLGFVEARKMLLNMSARRPAKLESFSAVLGLVSLNSDDHVSHKLAGLGLPSISYDDRRDLVETAIAEHVWMGTEDHGGITIGPLRARWPRLRFVRLLMNGADDVLKYRKWEEAGPRCRMITLGRPGVTETVRAAATRFGIDLDGGHFIMGPNLPDISSSEAREALINGDTPRAATLLNSAVLAWCQQHGPWRPTATDRTLEGGCRGAASQSSPHVGLTIQAVLSLPDSLMKHMNDHRTKHASLVVDNGYALVREDCFRVWTMLPTSCVDLICVDPPYGNGYKRTGGDQYKDDAFDAASWRKLLDEGWRVLKPGGRQLIFCSANVYSTLVPILTNDASINFNTLHWDRGMNSRDGHDRCATYTHERGEQILTIYKRAGVRATADSLYTRPVSLPFLHFKPDSNLPLSPSSLCAGWS